LIQEQLPSHPSRRFSASPNLARKKNVSQNSNTLHMHTITPPREFDLLVQKGTLFCTTIC
jgi:hypothetical protein